MAKSGYSLCITDTKGTKQVTVAEFGADISHVVDDILFT